MNVKKTIVSLGAAGAVFAGSVLVAAPAIAQDETTDTENSARQLAPRGHRHGKFITVVDVLGIEAEELRERLAAGETIADIAAAEGIDVEDVIDALVADAQERLDEAVAEERLTADEAEDRLTDIEDRVTDFVNGELTFPDRHRHGPGGFATGTVADVLGLEPAELAEQLEAGSTLADIAAEQGVAVDDLATAMLEPVYERIDAAVDSGDLTQEEGEAARAEAEARIAAIIDGEESLRGFGGRHGRRGPGAFGGDDTAEESVAETSTEA